MTKDPKRVADDVVVQMDYVLRLDDGEVVDQSAPGEPLQYLHGHNNIVPGLEQALTGLSKGDAKVVTVAAADGYGDYDPEAKQVVSATMFPADMEVTEGMSLSLRNQAGSVFPATVSKIQGEHILLDFNHPLAGKTLTFDVKIAGLRAATTEELAHGHVHTHSHSH